MSSNIGFFLILSVFLFSSMKIRFAQLFSKYLRSKTLLYGTKFLFPKYISNLVKFEIFITTECMLAILSYKFLSFWELYSNLLSNIFIWTITHTLSNKNQFDFSYSEHFFCHEISYKSHFQWIYLYNFTHYSNCSVDKF